MREPSLYMYSPFFVKFNHGIREQGFDVLVGHVFECQLELADTFRNVRDKSLFFHIFYLHRTNSLEYRFAVVTTLLV